MRRAQTPPIGRLKRTNSRRTGTRHWAPAISRWRWLCTRLRLPSSPPRRPATRDCSTASPCTRLTGQRPSPSCVSGNGLWPTARRRKRRRPNGSRLTSALAPRTWGKVTLSTRTRPFYLLQTWTAATRKHCGKPRLHCGRSRASSRPWRGSALCVSPRTRIGLATSPGSSPSRTCTSIMALLSWLGPRGFRAPSSRTTFCLLPETLATPSTPLNEG
mmetsp:Transcript_30650/g.88871  ORF Transcript_30650/g.88871 Transcript_30650/m.88871 type:complete len:216 (+) Transcript_30650:1737-2384(+)